MIRTGFRLAEVFLAMPPPASADPWQPSLDPDPAMQPASDPFQSSAPDPFQTPAQMPSMASATSTKDRNVSKTSIGLLLFVAGIILTSALAGINTFRPLLLDARLAYLAAIPMLAGAALVFIGRAAWPDHRRSAKVGLVLMAVGQGSTIVLGLIGYPYLLSFGPPTDVDSPYHRALMITVIWEIVNVSLVTAAIILLVWWITSEKPRKLIVAGNLIFLGYYVAGHVLSIVLYDPIEGGINLVTQPVVRILLQFFIVFLLVTNAIVILGLVVGKWRLPAAAAPS